MRRRDFITLLGGAVAWPLAARAQQAPVPVIGLLSSGSPNPDGPVLRSFRQGLMQAGFVEGRNVRFEYRWAANELDRLPELAADLVSRKVSVIFAVGGPSPALAAKAATTSIPIVFYFGVDPVETGVVTSLNRPGGNLTGFTTLNLEVGKKKLEVIHEVMPTAPIALLVNPTNPSTEAQVKDAQGASLRAWPIPSSAGSSRGSTARVGTSPASPTSAMPRCTSSTLNCSWRSRPGSSEPSSCSILNWPPYRPSCAHLRRRPGHSRLCQSLRPFIATKKSKRPWSLSMVSTFSTSAAGAVAK